MALSDYFVWGQNGQQLTQDEIERRRAIADALMKGASDYSPVGSWTQGAARVAQGVLGAFEDRSLDKSQRDNADYNTKLIDALMGGSGLSGGSPSATGTASASGTPSPGAASEIRATSPADISGLSKNDVYNGFIDTVKGGVTNPYGLAAIAATGTAESGFDPGNVGRSWNDGINNAGGIMSWNGPRLANLQRFSGGGNGTPQQQGQFFLQENPQLINALNNAKSIDEAQNLMNNAWAFKGYNIPGNANAASRLATARALLPSFQQVASAEPQTATDAIASVSPPQTQPTDQTQQALAYAAPAAAKAPYVDPTVVNVGPKVADASGAPVAATPAPQRVAQAVVPQIVPAQAPIPQAFNPAIIRALTDPRSNSQTRGVAQIILQQMLARDQAARQAVVQRNQAIFEQELKQSDPSYQADLRYKNAQTDQILNPRMSPAEQANTDLNNRKFAYDQEKDKTISPKDQADIDLNNRKFALEQQNSQLTNDVRDFNFAKQNGYQGNFADYQIALKQAGRPSTVINNGPNSNKFVEKSDEAAAKRFDDIVTAGQAAPQTMADMQQLLDIGGRIGTGKNAQIRAAIGPYADALGVKIDGLDDLQAYEAITSRLAPQMRAVGAGSSSDRDVALFFQSLPNLRNRPGANEMIGNTIKSVAQNKINAAAIARQAQSGKITWQEADDQISKLPDPYEIFKQFQKQSEDNRNRTSSGVQWSIDQ